MLLRSAIVASLLLGGLCVASGQEMLLGLGTNRELYQIDPNTGVATQYATVSAGGKVGALAYDPRTDTLYMSSLKEDRLYTVDYTTGEATDVGKYNLPSHPNTVVHGMEFLSDTGELYGHDGWDRELIKIDTNTGQGTVIGDLPFTSQVGSLAWDADNYAMYGADMGTKKLWNIDWKTGLGTLIGPLNATGADNLGTGLAWSPTYGLLGINNDGDDSLWRIDTNTGQTTLIGLTGTDKMAGLASVPEPASLLLLALAGVLIRQR